MILRSARPAGAFRSGALVGAVIAVLVIGTGLFVDSVMVRRDVTQVFTQPAGVEYRDGRTHYAGVVERRSWLLGRRLADEVAAGSDPSLSYRHVVTLRTGADLVVRDVEWSADELRLRFESGHGLSIPASAFTGGR